MLEIAALVPLSDLRASELLALTDYVMTATVTHHVQHVTCPVHEDQIAAITSERDQARAALVEANEMVLKFHMPYGWPDFQERNGLRKRLDVLGPGDL